MGKTVNLAARLETAAAVQGILISSETLLLVEEGFLSEPAEPVNPHIARVAGIVG